MRYTAEKVVREEFREGRDGRIRRAMIARWEVYDTRTNELVSDYRTRRDAMSKAAALNAQEA